MSDRVRIPVFSIAGMAATAAVAMTVAHDETPSTQPAGPRCDADG